MRASLQQRGPPGAKGETGEKGPQGARGLDGTIGPVGPSGQTICHYVFPITTKIDRSDLPSPYISVANTATATGWNTYRNSSTFPSYISWNNANQLAATKLHVSWIDNSGINVHKFLSMLRINDVVTIQSKTNHLVTQEWELNAAPISHDNCIEFSVTLANSDSVQISTPEHTHALLAFVYSGNALANANAAEARIAALESRVAALTARLTSAGIS
jgi:hypothetical protein